MKHQREKESTEDASEHPSKTVKLDNSDISDTAAVLLTRSRPIDLWFYPPEIANDLKDVDLPEKVKAEAYACAWEYARCVIPHYTNWKRYVAFMRTIVIGIIAEFRGKLVDVTAGDEILGYNLSSVLSELFEGTPEEEAMGREFRTFLLISADKTSERRHDELFRRYVNVLAHSPKQWFRMRDCDALARYTTGAALACNDQKIWFTEEQLDILTELGDTLYDCVAFYKHRSEGETNSTFAYMPQHLRIQAFREYREILWALDVAWARKPELESVINFTRFFGGPIHMMMRRYRFVEDNCTIGNLETEKVVDQTRQKFKLWNRFDAKAITQNTERYTELLARSDELMFDGLASFLEKSEEGHCDCCIYRDSYGAEKSGRFGGVQLCKDCVASWGHYLQSFPERAAKIFPELVLRQGDDDTDGGVSV